MVMLQCAAVCNHVKNIMTTASETERQAYIQEAQKDIIFYQQMVHSENDVVNTILAEKGLFCDEHQIHLSCSVDGVDLSFFRVADLYVILGNAIDNAIEYVEKFEDAKMRVIHFRIHQKNQFISIQINNPYVGASFSKSKLPQSTKPDSENHGFGLKSIQYLTKKYHGCMEISTNDNMFTLQLMIPLASQAKKSIDSYFEK